MTDTLSGTVTVVQAVTLGDILASSVSIGAASLTVEDAAYFSETGGTLRIGGTDPAAQIIAYAAADPATSLVTLASTVAAAWPAATPVDSWDPAVAAVFVEYRALVELPGAIDNADVLDCVISHALIPLLPQGIRDPGEGESVTVTSNGGEWTVVDVHGRTPSFDGARITPATITPLQVTFSTSGKNVTIGTTAPASPNTGDLWYDGNNGYQLNQWSGSAWVPFQFGTNAIAAGSVTADLIAANAVIAGAIAAGALDAQSIVAGTLTAGAISAGSIGASQILASSLAGCDVTIDPVGGTILIYAVSGQTVVNLTTPGASTWTVPAGVTSGKVECWGGGGGSEGTGSYGGCGGGAGEYAREDIYPLTPLANVPYTVGAGGAAGASGGAAAGPGGQTSFNSAVIAHGGSGGGTFGAGISVGGGTGSTNQVHFSGGRGHAAGGTFGSAGGGGGSSAGSTRSGNDGGAPAAPATGGVGGSAVLDGGAGGAGRDGGGAGLVGIAGSAPGGGAGGSGKGTTPQAGNTGGAGKIRITYGGARVLVASMAGVAGTDIYGNSYAAGIRTNIATAAGLSGGYYEELTFPQLTCGNGATINMKASATTRLTSDYGSAYNFTTGVWTAPADGIYDIAPGISFPAVTNSTRVFIDFSSATLSGGTVYQRFQVPSLAGTAIELSCIMTRYFASGTQVWLSFFQNGGASLNSITSRNNTVVFARRG